MSKWIDGGYSEGETVITDGDVFTLSVSLGSLGWVAINKATRRKTILIFRTGTGKGESDRGASVQDGQA